MSMILMARAMNIKAGNPLRKLILLKLADNANDKGECWPSYKHIADQCETSRRSVINHIDMLVEMGLIKIRHRKTPNGNTTNMYQLFLSGGENSAPLKAKGSPAKENDSLPSAADSPASADDSLPSETPAPAPSAAAAPRTSHSSEPINEPVSEPVTDKPTGTASADQHSNVFQIDSHIAPYQPANVPEQRFRMNWDWQPSKEFAQRCRMQGVNLALFDEEAQEQILGEFRSYWSDRAQDVCSHGQWEHKLAQRLKQLQAKTIARDNPPAATPQGKRAAVSAAVMDIEDTDW